MDNDMLINKAHWTTDKDSVRLSMPIGKVDVERRMVSGFATLDNIDKQDDIVTTEASLQAFKNFRGNLREMHQPSAVGKIVSFKEDKYFDPNSKKFYSGVYVSAYVSKGAQDAWEKVLDGTYSGFSIGGNIKSWDDAYNADMDKAIRIIKDYDLYELSLVDSPANQFASIISVEKVNGQNVISGASVDAIIENVFYDSENGIVLVSDSETAESPVSGKNMENIGFVEKSDNEKANMIKFLVDSAKGISTIKITKEVSQMTETTEAVVDAVVENVEITPEAQPAEVETPAVVDEAPADLAVAKSDDGGAVPSAPVVEEESVVPEVEAELAVAKSDESIVDAVAEIKNSLTNAFGDLAATIKSLNEQVEALSKSVDAVSTEVTQVKGQFNEFGKRVDAVEQDTAFRKSGDLGEIVQFEPVKVQKSLWGGRFLKNSDLFN
jgi:outer membrane murein-binding lipoprotein Lpp